MRNSDETEREKTGAQVQEAWVEQHGSQSTLEVTVYLSIDTYSETSLNRHLQLDLAYAAT